MQSISYVNSGGFPTTEQSGLLHELNDNSFKSLGYYEKFKQSGIDRLEIMEQVLKEIPPGTMVEPLNPHNFRCDIRVSVPTTAKKAFVQTVNSLKTTGRLLPRAGVDSDGKVHIGLIVKPPELLPMRNGKEWELPDEYVY